MKISYAFNRKFVSTLTRVMIVLSVVMRDTLSVIVPCGFCLAWFLISLHMLKNMQSSIAEIHFDGENVTFLSIKGESYHCAKTDLIRIKKNFLFEDTCIFQLQSGKKMRANQNFAELKVFVEGTACSGKEAEASLGRWG